MPTKAMRCDTCLFCRKPMPPHPSGEVECHVRSVENWFVRKPTDWCGEWRDPMIRYLPSYLSRSRGQELFRYLNKLLAWPTKPKE